MKRFSACILSGLVVLLVLASGQPVWAADKKPILGVSLPNLTNPYYVTMRKSFLENGEKNGFEVRVLIADNDDLKQLSQVQSFVEQKVDFVALNCTSSGPGVASVLELNKANIPVITVNLLPDPEMMKQQEATMVQAVETDQKMGGVYIGEQLVKDLNGAEAYVGIIGEPTSVSANTRDDGFKEAVAKSPNVKVHPVVVNGKVEETTALKVTQELLMGNPNMNIIYSDTEPAAIGAAKAIEQLGMQDRVKLYAFVDKVGVQMIIDGDLLMAGAIQEPDRLAQIVVENAVRHMKGEKLEPKYMSPPLLVNEENAKDVLSKAY
ncbi:MAG: substrate-binding domain-containing protein [Synergistaceae bacterium]|jgi:ribose transport system substrate-binding protein|nr:substrate-binding domain-containing protein [Synergistaceae bacterium]